VENERLALRRFARVHAACVWMPATHLEPGRVDAYGSPSPGMLHVGRYGHGFGASAGVDEASDLFVAELAASGLVARSTSEVMRWKWAKLLSNLGNAVEALVRPDEDTRPLLARVTAEGNAVLTAAKIDFASKAEERAMRGDKVGFGTIDGARREGGSTWQSLARGSGQLEGDFLNGEITLLGRLHGVATPLNAGLQRLATVAATEHWPPGSLSLAELQRRLGDAA
jgi:2-dehydropantoate 2-reductase